MILAVDGSLNADTHIISGPIHAISVLIAYAQMPLINRLSDKSVYWTEFSLEF